MLTKTMKLVSIAALLAAVTLWSYARMFDLPLRFVVGLGAVMVFIQAMRSQAYYWAAGFLAVAILFNPFVPLLGLLGRLTLAAELGAVVVFAGSLVALKTHPMLSIPSITDRTPGSRSL